MWQIGMCIVKILGGDIFRALYGIHRERCVPLAIALEIGDRQKKLPTTTRHVTLRVEWCIHPRTAQSTSLTCMTLGSTPGATKSQKASIPPGSLGMDNRIAHSAPQVNVRTQQCHNQIHKPNIKYHPNSPEHMFKRRPILQ